MHESESCYDPDSKLTDTHYACHKAVECTQRNGVFSLRGKNLYTPADRQESNSAGFGLKELPSPLVEAHSLSDGESRRLMGVHGVEINPTRKRKAKLRKRAKRKILRSNDPFDVTQLRKNCSVGNKSEGRTKFSSYILRNDQNEKKQVLKMTNVTNFTKKSSRKNTPCKGSNVRISTNTTNTACRTDPIDYHMFSDSFVFDSNEFSRLNYLFGPITMDGSANVHTAVHSTFCSEQNPLYNTNLRGHTIWFCPPFTEKIIPLLQYFESERQKYPYDIKAIIVLPRWYNTLGVQMQQCTNKYRKVHTYPSGTYLFSKILDSSVGTMESLGPTKWPIDVYVADSTVEERSAQAINDQLTTATLKSLLASPYNHMSDVKKKHVTPPPSKSQKSSSQVMVANLTSYSDFDLLKLNTKIIMRINDICTTEVPTRILLDCGATLDFISSTFVQTHKILLKESESVRVYLADGTVKMASSRAHTDILMGDKLQRRELIVTDLSKDFDVVLGMKWFKETNPQIDWSKGTILLDQDRVPIIATKTPREAHLTQITANEMKRILKKTIKNENDDTQIFIGVLQTCEKTITNEKTVEDVLSTVKTDFSDEYTSKVKSILKRHELILKPLTELPPRRPGFDHKIEILPGPEIPAGKIYKISPAELEELKKQLTKYLDKKWIHESISEFASPILFVRKPKSPGELRMCVDYRRLNQITKNIEYPLPSIDVLLDCVSGAKVWTALDLATGYHQLRMEKSSEKYTSFKTQYGLWEFSVLPFGLKTAPASFQRLMNHILKPHRNPFLIVYLDDILIFSNNPEDHINHLEYVFDIMEKNYLHLRIDKCLFARKELEYLGHIVGQNGIHPSDRKITAVKEWPVPKSVKEIQSFCGFTNYYRRYIKDYSKIAVPLYELTRKNVKFEWTARCNSAFHTLKRALCTAPVLMSPHTGSNAEFTVITDASKYAIGAVLLQKDLNDQLRPIAYYAKALSAAQTQYPTYDQELLAICCALSEWRTYLEGCKHINVITDHATLRHIPTQNKMERRHVKWCTTFSDYMGYLDIYYRKGEQNQADALSRRPDLNYLINQYEQVTFEKDLEDFHEFLNGITHLQGDSTLLEEIQTSYTKDTVYTGAILPVGVKYDTDTQLYWLADKIVIPNDTNLRHKIIYEFHDVLGHPDLEGTIANLQKTFYWSHLRKTLKSYIRNCPICQKIKSVTRKPYGTLYPLPVPKTPWEFLSMDFITNLPLVDGYDAICTFVDCYTKQAHFIPCSTKINAEQLAKLYIKNIFKLHGLSRVMIGDRDTKFTSQYWRTLMKEMKTKLNLSSAYHPQTDGQTERTHRTIEQILRAFVHRQHINWLNDLPLAEFSYNNTRHSSTKYSPFESLYGYSPILPISIIQPPIVNENDIYIQEKDIPSKVVNVIANISVVQTNDIDKNTMVTLPPLRRIHEVHKVIYEEIKIAKEFQSYYANKRANNSLLEFKIGDKVVVKTDYILIRNQPSKKFKQRYIGPYPIIDKISPQAYKLELPKSVELHPVFHISKLKPWNTIDPTKDEVDIIAARTDCVYGRIVDKIIDVKIARHTSYERGPALLFKTVWQDTRLSPSYEPYVQVKNLEVMKTYISNNKKFDDLIKSAKYQKLSNSYPQRFPKQF